MGNYIMHDGWLCKWPKYEEQAGCCFLPKWAMGWLFLSHSDHVPHAFLTSCRINKPCRVFLCVCRGGGTISLHSLLKTPRCTVVKMHLVFHPPSNDVSPLCSVSLQLQFSMKAVWFMNDSVIYNTSPRIML